MKLGRFMAAAGLLLALLTVAAEENGKQPSVLPIGSAVIVKEVRGQVEYAYDSTGWQKLDTGKVLRAGASIRTGEKSTALLQLANTSSLLRLTPGTKLVLTSEPPQDEVIASSMSWRVRQARVRRIRNIAVEQRVAALAQHQAQNEFPTAIQARLGFR